MHTLAFLDPGHFHAALTLREPNPRVSPEVFVYAAAGAELDDFLALIDRFNRRTERPTAWRPRVRLSADPLAQLLAERPGDLVVLAGRNGGKARVIQALHAAGLHVLADKPWLVEPGDLAAIRASLAGGALVREMMTGRRDPVARLVKHLVDDPGLFGGFDPDAAFAIEQESVHHFEKRVDGVPLRRPWWYFDSRVQGGGAVDIPTHLVDQAQWWLAGTPDGVAPRLLSARGWSTRVPLDVFARVTGAPSVPPALAPAVEDGALRVFSNAALVYRLAGVTARATARWEPSTPPGGGDTSRVILRGRQATISLEQTAETAFRRRLRVEACRDAAATARALEAALEKARAELPTAAGRADAEALHEVVVEGADGGHEGHFALLLAEALEWIDAGHRPADLADRTLAKYALLAEAVAATAAHAAAGR